MIKILFVDDDPFVLQGIRRMLHSMRDQWETHYSNSGRDALKVLETQGFDVLVTDMRMPEMNGVQLLERVRELYPETTRFVLSGQSDQALVMHAAKLAHQFLAKPCEPSALKQAVAQSCASRELLADGKLKQILSCLQSIPSNPVVYMRLLEALKLPTVGCTEVAEIVSSDPALSAKILQLVNSAFFGLPHRVANIAQAVSLLGIETIKALALAIPIFSKYEGITFSNWSLDELWAHSMRVAVLAKGIILTTSSDQKLAGEAFVGGLLHDVGKLLLATNMPQEYEAVQERIRSTKASSSDIEREVFGASHAYVGGFVLGTWGLPEPVVHAVTYHEEPCRRSHPEFTSLTAVYAANAFDGIWPNVQDQSLQSEDDCIAATLRAFPPEFLAEIQTLGCTQLLPKWVKRCVQHQSHMCQGEEKHE